MRYGSLCSGIEVASVAWEPLGWQPAWFAGIEPFLCAVLAHHWPHVPNHGGMTLLVGKILSRAPVLTTIDLYALLPQYFLIYYIIMMY